MTTTSVAALGIMACRGVGREVEVPAASRWGATTGTSPTSFAELLADAQRREQAADDEMWHRSAEGSGRGLPNDRLLWKGRR